MVVKSLRNPRPQLWGPELHAYNPMSNNNHVSTWPSPSLDLPGYCITAGAWLEAAPALIGRNIQWQRNADACDTGSVPWSAGHNRIIPPSKTCKVSHQSYMPLASGTHVASVSLLHTISSFPKLRSSARPHPATTPGLLVPKSLINFVHSP